LPSAGCSPMPSKKSPSSRSHDPRRRLSIWWLLLVPALAIGAAVPLSSWADRRVSLKYGEFKAKLVRGEVRSASVGPAEINGELKQKDGRGRSIAFSTSRVGMERDEQLAQQLQQYLPDGAYDSDPGPLGGQASL